MSRGPGQIERAIIELFVAVGQQRALSVGDLCEHAFALAGAPASRAQRISATRAAHRILQRIRRRRDQISELYREAEAQAAAAGHERPVDKMSFRQGREAWEKYAQAKSATPAGTLHDRLEREFYRCEHKDWRMTEMPGRRIVFHSRYYPVRIWAVSIQRAGVLWQEVDAITRITEKFVSIRYQGQFGRLDRLNLCFTGAWWRGVRFATERDGYAARRFDEWWHERYGHEPLPPAMRMPLADAMRLLGVGPGYTREDIIAAFRRAAKKAHPDLGGTAEQFRALVIARGRLLASLGTSEPPPKMPNFYPSGVQVRYRSARRRGSRLGYTRRIGHAAD